MAFSSGTLIQAGGAPYLGRTLWVYSTADAITLVDDTDYFAGALYLGMKVGDPVIVVVTTGPTLHMACVAAIDADGNATLTAPLAIVAA